jgi:HAD superfamily hydrolase (TIGR01549 family)
VTQITTVRRGTTETHRVRSSVQLFGGIGLVERLFLARVDGMPAENRYDAVLFDLDNTLIPFLGPLRRWARTWAETARPSDPDPVREALVEVTLDEVEDPERAVRVVADRFDLADEADEATERARRTYWRALTPYAGIRATLARLNRADVTLGVVTDAPRKRAAIRLAATQLTRRFDVVVTRDDTDGGKTSPRPFHLALDELNVAAEDALMVGDWPAFDVRWPNRIGMGTVLAAWGTSSLPDHARSQAQPDLEADDPRQVRRMALGEPVATIRETPTTRARSPA